MWDSILLREWSNIIAKHAGTVQDSFPCNIGMKTMETWTHIFCCCQNHSILTKKAGQDIESEEQHQQHKLVNEQKTLHGKAL